MPEILDANFPELPEGYWWKKELSGNYRALRTTHTYDSVDGKALFALHHESDGFALDDSIVGWGVFKSFSSQKLADGLTAQEAVNFAYAMFILGDNNA